MTIMLWTYISLFLAGRRPQKDILSVRVKPFMMQMSKIYSYTVIMLVKNDKHSRTSLLKSLKGLGQNRLNGESGHQCIAGNPKHQG